MKDECGAATYGGSAKCYNDYATCRWHKGWRRASAVPARPEPNTVDHPRHYNVGKIEAITVIEDWNLNFNLGNCVKYVARADHKGNAVEDLKKALWYLQRELDRRGA